MARRGRAIALPPRLRSGDRVGIIAPAGPLDAGTFDRGVQILESMGFRTVVSEDLFASEGYLAGPDAHRAALVNRYFEDDSIDAIFCARGGFGSMRILPLLDFASIRANPKVLVGFSDVSALLSALYSRCGFVTFHGPVVSTLGDATSETREHLLSVITSDLRYEIKADGGVAIMPGSATGPVAGGNLSTLCHLIGTGFEPDFEGHILFLEDRGEASYRIDRMLTQMRLAGSLDGIAGLALGSFEDCGPMDEIIQIVRNLFDDAAVPILSGFGIGHGPNNTTVPVGLEATLDTSSRSLLFHGPPTVAR